MNMPNHNKLMLAVLTVHVLSTSGFLLNNQCTAPSPCICTGSDTIDCHDNALTHIPSLGALDVHTIYLYNNRITLVPANIFQNVSSSHTRGGFMDIDLDNNMVSTVDPLAFAGLENITLKLKLSNNQLASLPVSLKNLNKVEALFLQGNPLISMDSTLMAHLSSTLTEFGFDMRNFNTWPPTDLSTLQHLRTLVVQNIGMSRLPLDAFVGLEAGLSSLTLSHTKLVQLPESVCQLQNLRVLTFNDNTALYSNFSSLEPCVNKMDHLTALYLTNNSLRRFPNVLNTFPYLTHLSLDNNDIRFVPSRTIPPGHGLRILYFRNNQLTRIPSAINKLVGLRSLILDGNDIRTVEDNDLMNLSSLLMLHLNANPVEYISPQAFKHTTGIVSLCLNSTSLELVPEAVIYLPNVDQLFFQNTSIDCSCRMSYLRGWDVTNVRDFRGDCEHQLTRRNDGIKQFIMTSLPACP